MLLFLFSKINFFFQFSDQIVVGSSWNFRNFQKENGYIQKMDNYLLQIIRK